MSQAARESRERGREVNREQPERFDLLAGWSVRPFDFVIHTGVQSSPAGLSEVGGRQEAAGTLATGWGWLGMAGDGTAVPTAAGSAGPSSSQHRHVGVHELHPVHSLGQHLLKNPAQ